MTIAIIPVRGGSKRIPRKNVKEFCGHPLMAWSVVAARWSKLIDHVVVSTDDDEMEEVARKYGADEIIRRPDWPDADEAAGNRPLLHAVNELAGKYGTSWTMVTMFATSPQRLPGDLDGGIQHMRKNGLQNVVGMSRKRETFIYEDKELYAQSVIRDKYQQHFELTSGLVNVITAGYYRWLQTIVTDDSDKSLNDDFRNTTKQEQFGYVETRPWQIPETDTQEEFELCELIMEHYVLKGRGIEIYEEYYNERTE